MLGSLAISEWVPALIAVWLALQLPVGMAVGNYLRRAEILSTVEVKPVALTQERRWQHLLSTRIASAASRVSSRIPSRAL